MNKKLFTFLLGLAAVFVINGIKSADNIWVLRIRAVYFTMRKAY